MRSIRCSGDLERVARGLALAAAATVLLSCRDQLAAPIPSLHDEAAGPRKGGTLRLASLADVRNLDPAGPVDGLALEAVHLIFAGLVDFDDRGRVVEGVADRWDVKDEGRTYRFHLMQGVRMQDGDELTSDDVVRSVERALDPATPNPNASYFSNIEKVTADDRYVVTFHLKAADATFLPLLAMPTLRPTCKSAGRQYSDSWLPCGAGPFRLEPDGWQRGTRLRLVRHDGYFRTGLPHLDGVEWTYNMQALPQRFRFEDGTLDLMRDLSHADQARFMADPRWRALGTAEADVSVFGESMNTRLPPFDKVEIRRAVAAVIDRGHFRAMEPFNITPLTQVIPPDVPGYDPHFEGQRYDYQAALAHMAKAGFPYDPATQSGGWPDPVDYLFSDEGAARYSVQIVQQELAKIGIRLTLKAVSFSAYLALLTDPTRAGMAPVGWSMDYPDPSSFFGPLFASSALVGDATNSSSFYSNPEVDRLLELAHGELDPVRRADIFGQANRIVCDDAPWAFTFVYHSYDLRQPYVHGFVVHPVWGRDVSRVWLDDPRTGGRP
jgi:ABC-type transport system substrate-binding protein